MQMADGGRLCRLRDWGSKLPGAALRIAGLLHLATDSKVLPVLRVQIEQSEIAIALKICATLVSHAVAVFEMVRQDPIVSRAKRILRWLLARKTEPVSTKKMCFDALHPHIFEKVDEMELCLKIFGSLPSQDREVIDRR
jgi:hypothetical protein